MTSHTTRRTFDLSGLKLAGTHAYTVRRSAELARAEYLGEIFKKVGHRITTTYRSAGELIRFTQRQNQAARL